MHAGNDNCRVVCLQAALEQENPTFDRNSLTAGRARAATPRTPQAWTPGPRTAAFSAGHSMQTGGMHGCVPTNSAVCLRE
eukprot:scaffold161949_cov13-Tisochrysis_lutea.AAC.1